MIVKSRIGTYSNGCEPWTYIRLDRKYNFEDLEEIEIKVQESESDVPRKQVRVGNQVSHENKLGKDEYRVHNFGVYNVLELSDCFLNIDEGQDSVEVNLKFKGSGYDDIKNYTIDELVKHCKDGKCDHCGVRKALEHKGMPTDDCTIFNLRKMKEIIYV